MHKKIMGVINITPDSFSDASQFYSRDSFAAQFNKVSEWADIIDIGAESTAPFNQRVEQDQELERFEKIFFPFVLENDDPEKTISIDTYKVEVFHEVYKVLKKHWPDSQIIFNDVSGKLDNKLLDLLTHNTNVHYVFSHNLAPSREQTSDHMRYLFEGSNFSFLESFVNYFLEGINELKQRKLSFIIDPCFGFSKTREQNHYLLAHFKTFLLQVPYDVPCLVGLSKKSFLRFPKELDITTVEGEKSVEQVHSNILYHLFFSQLKRDFIIRTHCPRPVQSALDSLSLFEL